MRQHDSAGETTFPLHTEIMIAFPDQQYLYAWTQDLYFELNDDSGIFLVVPIGLFILRATGSLLFVWW